MAVVEKKDEVQRQVERLVRDRLFEAALEFGTQKINITLDGDTTLFVYDIAKRCGYPVDVVLGVIIAIGMKREEDAGRFPPKGKKPVRKRAVKTKAAKATRKP